MKRYEAIEAILNLLVKDTLAVFSTGMISREAFCIEDRPQNFYMLGSMGLAPAIGLGLALNTNRKVVVFDGDGSLLMELGILPLIGYLKPKNLIHIVLDNQVYGSTGGQSTVSTRGNLALLASHSGYENIFGSSGLRDTKDKFKSLLNLEGPSFLLARVSKTNVEGIIRIPIKPEVIKERFMKCID